jgi:20S proteasome subunit alpha 3
MPVEQLVKHVCNYKQHVTQYGGLRPYGVAFVFAGWDRHHGFQVYQSDPSGNFSGWRATVIGQNNQAGKSVGDNLKLAIKIMLKTMDSTTPTAERIELSKVVKSPADGSVTHVVLSDAEVGALIEQVQKELDAETAKAEASAGDI